VPMASPCPHECQKNRMYLSPGQLSALSQYKYSSADYSALDKLLTPYWEWVVRQLPLWVAPNLITFTGLVIMLANAALLALYSPTLQQPVPTHIWAIAALALWTYQTLDAIDGKQARRTASSSPLGQLFDHGCDAIATSIVAANACAALQFSGTQAMLCHAFHITSFFVSNWEE
jgi:phosphatidylglycerophosphate synthase